MKRTQANQEVALNVRSQYGILYAIFHILLLIKLVDELTE